MRHRSPFRCALLPGRMCVCVRAVDQMHLMESTATRGDTTNIFDNRLIALKLDCVAACCAPLLILCDVFFSRFFSMQRPLGGFPPCLFGMCEFKHDLLAQLCATATVHGPEQM